MNHNPLRAIWGAWAVLVVATLLAWADSEVLTSAVAGVVLLVLSVTKIGIVMGIYQEIAAAPRWLRLTAAGWLVVVAATVTSLLVARS